MRIQLAKLSIPLLFLSLLSCTKQSTNPSNIEKYVTAYTQGMIDEDEEIQMRFSELTTLDSTALSSSIRFKPSISFSSNYDKLQNRLYLKPTSKFKRGTAYKLEVNLAKLLNEPSLGVHTIDLKVFEQFVKISKQGVELKKGEESNLLLRVETSLDEEKESIASLFDYPKEKISVEQKKKNEYDVKLSFDPAKGAYAVAWDGNSLDADQQGKIEWDYRLTDYKVVDSYFDRSSNSYTVYFSKLLDDQQDLKGLVLIGGKDANYQLRNNSIKVFLGTRTNENQELYIDKSVKSDLGESLASSYNHIIEATLVKPQIEWLEYGVYIPSDGAFKVPFRARNSKTASENWNASSKISRTKNKQSTSNLRSSL